MAINIKFVKMTIVIIRVIDVLLMDLIVILLKTLEVIASLVIEQTILKYIMYK
jgi:hypothetical protein